MAQRHDYAVIAARSDSQTVRKIVVGDDQRVIAGDAQRAWYSGEERAAVMGHRRGLAMHYLCCAYDAPAHGLGDALMTKANTEQRPAAGKEPDRLQRNAGALRRAGARRDHHMAWGHRLDLAKRHRIVADHLDGPAAFADVAGE